MTSVSSSTTGPAPAHAVPPPGERPLDITVFGCTGNAGRAVAYHVLRAVWDGRRSSDGDKKSSIKVGLAGRSRDRVEKVIRSLKDEIGIADDDENAPDARIVIADASDDASMIDMARSTRVLISCAGPFGRYGEAAVKACVRGGSHYLDITGEVPWVARMAGKYGDEAKKNGVALLPFSGYDCVPAEIGMNLVGQALKAKGAEMGKLDLSFLGEGAGFPRGTLETILDEVEGKSSDRNDGDPHFYPKEYRALAKAALSPLSFVLPKWSSNVSSFTGPNFMAAVNIPVLCRSAATIGFGPELSISDRSLISRPNALNLYGLIATQMYITALVFVGLSFVLPPFRWWLRRKLQTYSYPGNIEGTVEMNAEGKSTDGTAMASARLVVPGDPGIYATGLFAAGVALALLEATLESSSLRPLAGCLPPVAALHNCEDGLLVNQLERLGASVDLHYQTKDGNKETLDAAKLK